MWNQAAFEIGPLLISYDETGKRVRWSQPLSGGRIDHWVSVENDAPTGSMGTQQIPDDVLLRLRCHVLTNWMPDEALPELGETLGEMYQFYRDRRVEGQSVGMLPYIENFDTELLEPTVRPAFEFAEE